MKPSAVLKADELRGVWLRASLPTMFYRKSILAVLLGLIFLSFFGTLAASAWMFPQNYDWRYRVISNLLSPRDNPGHYWLATIGLTLTALLMLPFAGHLQRHLEVASPRVARMSSGAFVTGIIALICACFIVPNTCMMCSEFDGCTNFLPAPLRASSQLECYAAAGARGRAGDEACLRRDCFGPGRW